MTRDEAALLWSLSQALYSAHGRPSVDHLLGMTVEEFLTLLAPNRIRFKYIGPEDKK